MSNGDRVVLPRFDDIPVLQDILELTTPEFMWCRPVEGTNLTASPDNPANARLYIDPDESRWLEIRIEDICKKEVSKVPGTADKELFRVFIKYGAPVELRVQRPLGWVGSELQVPDICLTGSFPSDPAYSTRVYAC